jgi:hypothetical protein
MKGDEYNAVAERQASWRELRETGLVGRFMLLCLGVWLHAADMLVTATTPPAIVADIGGVPYVSWMISLYQVGAIIAGAASAVLSERLGGWPSGRLRCRRRCCARLPRATCRRRRAPGQRHGPGRLSAPPVSGPMGRLSSRPCSAPTR